MCVCETQSFEIKIAMLDDELACERLTFVPQHFATRFGIGEDALFAREEQLFLFFDAFSLPEYRGESKNKACHWLRHCIEAPQRLLVPGCFADSLTQKMPDRFDLSDCQIDPWIRSRDVRADVDQIFGFFIRREDVANR